MKKIFIIVITFITFVLYLRFFPYKELADFKQRDISTKVYDRYGVLLQITSVANGAKHEYIALKNMPPIIKTVFILSEDKRFYSHYGIDILALTRALKQNIMDRQITSGASTITMQLARLIIPKKHRTIFSKIQETFDALRLELRLSKNEILELYLNNIPFGFNTIGVSSAARNFFAKDILDISIQEALCLAVIPRRPNQYNPLLHKDNCVKAAFLLSQKLPEPYSNITQESIFITACNAKSFSYPFYVPHYIRYLQDKGLLFHKDSITLCIDLKIQLLCQKLLQQAISLHKTNRITQGAILVTNTQTGEIIAWLGSSDFFDTKSNGQVDGIISYFSPGSTMKPFLYALALENGYTPNSLLPDTMQEYGEANVYVPQNFNNRYNGTVRLRTALASSLNVPAVALLNAIGVKKYITFLSTLHFNINYNTSANLSLSLGAESVKLQELVQAFSVFCRDGNFIPLQYTLPLSPTVPVRVMQKDTARLICDILIDNSSRSLGFGNTKAFDIPIPAIFKTGTANQYQYISCLCSTPLYTIGVWQGNFYGNTVIGKTGSSLPAFIAKTILKNIQNIPVPLKKPTSYHKENICATSGLLATSFCTNTIPEYIKPPLHFCTHTSKVIPQLEILHPKDNSVFFYDEALDKGQQTLCIKAIATDNYNIHSFLDGKPIMHKIIDNKINIIAPITKGYHTLQITTSTKSQKISWEVK